MSSWPVERGLRHSGLRSEPEANSSYRNQPSVGDVVHTDVFYLGMVCGRVGVCFVVG